MKHAFTLFFARPRNFFPLRFCPNCCNLLYFVNELPAAPVARKARHLRLSFSTRPKNSSFSRFFSPKSARNRSPSGVSLFRTAASAGAGPSRSPPFSLAARSGAAYPEIRRQANLSVPLLASLLPMPAQPSVPLFFRWRREASPRIQKIRRQANLPASPYPFRFSLSLPRVRAPPSAPRHFRWRREASPRIQKIRRQANLPALVGEDCQGGGRPPP